MGAGMSHIVMVNNAVRMLAFPAAIAGLILIGGIEGIVSGFLLAEWLAFLTGLTMTNRAQRRPLWHGVGRFLFFLTGSALRSEEHTSELQSLMRSSYAVFCL